MDDNQAIMAAPQEEPEHPQEITDLNALKKDELISLLKQMMNAGENQTRQIKEMEATLENYRKQYESLSKNFQEYHDHASKVIEENNRHAEARINAVFNLITNARELLARPDYSFLDEPKGKD